MQDVIHVMESKPIKRHGDYFLRQILKVSIPPLGITLLWTTTTICISLFLLKIMCMLLYLQIFTIILQFEEMIGELEKVQFDWAW